MQLLLSISILPAHPDARVQQIASGSHGRQPYVVYGTVLSGNEVERHGAEWKLEPEVVSRVRGLRLTSFRLVGFRFAVNDHTASPSVLNIRVWQRSIPLLDEELFFSGLAMHQMLAGFVHFRRRRRRQG